MTATPLPSVSVPEPLFTSFSEGATEPVNVAVALFRPAVITDALPIESITLPAPDRPFSERFRPFTSSCAFAETATLPLPDPEGIALSEPALSVPLSTDVS